MAGSPSPTGNYAAAWAGMGLGDRDAETLKQPIVREEGGDGEAINRADWS